MNSSELRRRDLAKIHVAKKELALSDEDYRALLWSVARVRSAGQLDSAGRHRVIEHMVSRGFKPRAKGRTRPAASRELMVAKIRALLINDAGGPLPDTYADAIARQMFKVERFEWCTPEQLHKIVQALEVKKRDRVRAKKAEAKISS
jgi:phage gp16-like protein